MKLFGRYLCIRKTVCVDHGTSHGFRHPRGLGLSMVDKWWPLCSCSHSSLDGQAEWANQEGIYPAERGPYLYNLPNSLVSSGIPKCHQLMLEILKIISIIYMQVLIVIQIKCL